LGFLQTSIQKHSIKEQFSELIKPISDVEESLIPLYPFYLQKSGSDTRTKGELIKESYKGKEVRMIRDNQGFYYLTSANFKNVYVFKAQEGKLVLENKIFISDFIRWYLASKQRVENRIFENKSFEDIQNKYIGRAANFQLEGWKV
jgi:hypothetical protein